MVRSKRFIGKTTTQDRVKTVIKQRQRSVHRMVGSSTREARERVRRGCLLDEGADCHLLDEGVDCQKTKVRSGFGKGGKRQFQTDP